jgi:hypothetical protein
VRQRAEDYLVQPHVLALRDWPGNAHRIAADGGGRLLFEAAHAGAEQRTEDPN